MNTTSNEGQEMNNNELRNEKEVKETREGEVLSRDERLMAIKWVSGIGIDEYYERCNQFDNKFNILVKKGGMSKTQYNASKHFYALGVFK